MSAAVHAHCGCRPCLRARVTMCGLPVREVRQQGRSRRYWCVVCAAMLAAMLAGDDCPRVAA